MSFVEQIYEAVVRLGISERERSIEMNRLRTARHVETSNIDSALIAELSRGSVRMKQSLLKHRTQHEADLAEFMEGPTRPATRARCTRWQ